MRLTEIKLNVLLILEVDGVLASTPHAAAPATNGATSLPPLPSLRHLILRITTHVPPFTTLNRGQGRG